MEAIGDARSPSASGPRGVQQSAPHGDGQLQDALLQTHLAQCVEAPLGEGQIDAAARLGLLTAHISPGW